VLNVRDVEPLLDADELLYTKDRQNLVPDLFLHGVLEDLEAQCKANFVAFAEFASSNDIRTDDLQHVTLRKREDLAFLDTSSTRQLWISSKSHMQAVETRLRKTLQEAQDAAAVTHLDPSNFQAPRPVIAHLANAVLSKEQSSTGGNISLEENGLRFTPRSALEQEASQAHEQHQNLVRRIISDIQRDGHCIHTRGSVSSSALVGDVKDHWWQENIPLENLDDQSTICFITAEHLQSARDLLLTMAIEVAERSYHERDLSTDVVFGPEVLQSLTTSFTSPQLSSILIAKDSQLLPIISSSFAERLSHLQSRVNTTYQTTVRAQLLAPTQLYAAGCGLVSDTSLRSKLTSYTHEYLQSDLLPAAIASILNPSTIPSKATHAEVLKLQTSLAEASTMDDIESALRRLARRTKVATNFDDHELQCIKRDILSTKIAGMRSMKRASDVLQNLLWTLLATAPFPAPAPEPGLEPDQKRKEALWVSSGKDTTRMIKYYRQVAEAGQGERIWAAWGEELSDFRDKVKEGETSEGIKGDMAALAERALQAWLSNGYTEPAREGSENGVDT